MLHFREFVEYGNSYTTGIMNWPSSFAEYRAEPIGAISPVMYSEEYDYGLDPAHSVVGSVRNRHSVLYNGGIHDLMKPELDDSYHDLLRDFADGKSVGMNRDAISGKSNPDSDKLSSLFTVANTNKGIVEAYSLVPAKIGAKFLRMGHKAVRNLGYVSTSTSRSVPYSYGSDPIHLVHYKIMPGRGLSLAHSSRYPENEVLLDKGSLLNYTGHSVHQNADGSKTFVHSVIVE